MNRTCGFGLPWILVLILVSPAGAIVRPYSPESADAETEVTTVSFQQMLKDHPYLMNQLRSAEVVSGLHLTSADCAPRTVSRHHGKCLLRFRSTRMRNAGELAFFASPEVAWPFVSSPNRHRGRPEDGLVFNVFRQNRHSELIRIAVYEGRQLMTISQRIDATESNDWGQSVSPAEITNVNCALSYLHRSGGKCAIEYRIKSGRRGSRQEKQILANPEVAMPYWQPEIPLRNLTRENLTIVRVHTAQGPEVIRITKPGRQQSRILADKINYLR